MDLKRKKIKEFLLEKGFYLNDGIKYGLDFLVYTEHPDLVHSKYGLVVLDQMNFQQLIALQRICTSNNKTLIVAMVNEDDSITFIQNKRFELKTIHKQFDVEEFSSQKRYKSS